LDKAKLIVIDRGTIFPSDTSGKALDAPLSRTQLANGSARFAIENGVLKLQAGQTVATMEGASPILDAIAALQFEAVYLRKTSLSVLLPDGRTETLLDVDGELINRRKTSLSLKGKGELRGQRVQFEITSGIPSDQRPGTTVPLKIAIKSALADVNFDGRAGFSGPTQIHGALEFSAPHIRQIARWFGSSWASGSGLRNLSGRAQLDWAGPAMAFNSATVLMDGNEATGTLHLKFADARPSIGGTLALGTLDLGRYFPSQSVALPGISNTAWTSLLASDLTLPLLQNFDVDLRLSANKVRLGTFQAGRSAAAINVSKGRMLADIGAFEFDGGHGTGQISADMSGPLPKIAVRGRLDDLDATRITTSLFGHPALGGKATLTADIASSGKTGDDLLVSSNGRMSVAIRNGGKFGVDLRNLANSAQKRAVEGWGNAGRGQTAFDELDAAFQVRAGTLVADDVKARAGDLATAFSGLIDVPTGRLNLSIRQVPALQAPVKPVSNIPNLSLQIFGPWSGPTSRNESASDRAADPGLGAVAPARL
jgi:AsmA protein